MTNKKTYYIVGWLVLVVLIGLGIALSNTSTSYQEKDTHEHYLTSSYS